MKPMVNISGPFSIGQVQSYYREDYQEGTSEWQGNLAQEMHFMGEVEWDRFNKLAAWDEHTRAAWDLCISAPKTVSDAALVGGDSRVQAAHENAARVVLRSMEWHVRVKHAAGRGEWIAAMFWHSTSRPVGEHPPQPQLHAHCVIFNMGRDVRGDWRTLEMRAVYQAQRLGTALYRRTLREDLIRLGYRVSWDCEIEGYPKEYIRSISERREQIKEEAAAAGYSSAKSLQIAAWRTRGEKQRWSPEELRSAWRAHAAKYGSPGQKIVERAMERTRYSEFLKVEPVKMNLIKLDVHVEHADKDEWRRRKREDAKQPIEGERAS